MPLNRKYKRKYRRRRGRKRRRSYRRATSSKAIARKALRYVKTIARTRPKPEVKYLAASWSDTAIAPTVPVTILLNSSTGLTAGSGLPQGPDGNDRVGGEVKEHGLDLRLWIEPTAVVPTDEGLIPHVYCDIIVARLQREFDDDTTTGPDSTEVMTGNAIVNHYWVRRDNSGYKGKYHVLKYKRVFFTPPTECKILQTTTGTAYPYAYAVAPNTKGGRGFFYKNWKIRLNKILHFKATEAFPQLDRVYMFLVPGSGNQINLEANAAWRFYYTDN